ncbi:hypothetical protein GJ496_002236 [Pomphorhynchus laevis]|nr:hypothetical protein GJ496_002236 [Pomphorhynchus laevis]
MSNSEQIEKNDIFDWFCRSHAKDRIIFLTDLIQFCLPLELRYLFTCVKHLSSQENRLLDRLAIECCNEKELSSTVSKVTDSDTSKLNSASRSRLLTALSLLNEDDLSCARIYFRFLMNSTFPREDDEMVLMLVMAQRHPAFAGHMQRMLADRAQNLLPDIFKGSLSTDEESLLDCNADSNLNENILDIHNVYICDFRPADIFTADNPFTMSADSVEIYAFWKKYYVTAIRRGLCDFYEFKRILDVHFGSQVIPELEIPDNNMLNQDGIENSLNEFMRNLLKLPRYIYHSSFVYEFLLAVNHEFITNESKCTTFTSADGKKYRYPKQALLICNSLDTLCYLTNIEEDSKPSNCSCNIDKCEQPSNKAEKKRSTKTKKAQSKPTLADDLINSVDFLLHNNEYLTPQDVNELLDGNTLTLAKTDVPEKIQSKLTSSLNTLQKWHSTLMNQSSANQISSMAPLYTQPTLVPAAGNLIPQIYYQPSLAHQMSTLGLYPEEHHKMIAWAPMYPFLPPVIRCPAINFQPTLPCFQTSPEINIMNQSTITHIAVNVGVRDIMDMNARILKKIQLLNLPSKMTGQNIPI